MPPRVLVSVLSYNDWDSLTETMASLEAQMYSNRELLIVDNCSDEAFRERLRWRYPHVTIIETDANLGFGGGNNVALRYGLAHGFDYVLLCNDDITIERDAVERLIAAVVPVADLGAAGAVEMDHTGAHRVSCGGSLRWYASRIHWRTGVPRSAVNGLIDSFSPQGAFMLFSRQALERGVLLDETLFMYCDELELGYRLRQKQLTVKVCTDVRYRHKAGGNRIPRGLSTRNAYFISRNRVLVARKHLGAVRFSVFVFVYALELGLKAMWRSFASPSGFVKAMVRGGYDGIRGRTIVREFP